MVVRVGDRCPWGALCRFGAAGKCRGEHTVPEDEHFAKKREIQQMEAKAPCAFCVRGCCRFGAGCRRGMREDSDYSGSEDEERTREDTGGQQRHPDETRCEGCAADDVVGALEKGEVEYRYGVRRHERHENEDSGWVHTEARVTTYAVAPETLGTGEELLKMGGYYVALAVPEKDDATVQEQPGLDVEALLRQAEMEQSCRLQEWSQWTFRCRDGGSDVGVRKAGRRKGQRVRVRKRWARTSRCLRRAATQRMTMEILACVRGEMGRVISGEGWRCVQMVRWGFTVWSWWVRWDKSQQAEVMAAIGEDEAVMMAKDMVGVDGMPLATVREYEVAEEARGAGGRKRGGNRPGSKMKLHTRV